MNAGNSSLFAPISRHLPSALLVVAFVVYLIVWRNSPISSSDTGTYQTVAKDLLEEGVPRIHLRGIGYPLLLIATGSTDSLSFWLFAVQLFLYLAGTFLLIDIIRSLGFRTIPVLLLTAAMLLPPAVSHTMNALTETITQFMLVLMVWCIVRHPRSVGWCLLGGFAAGYAALCRPSYQLLGLAVTVLLVFWRHYKAATAVFLSSALLVGGISWWNWKESGYFGTSAALGYHLCTKTVRFLDRLPPSPVRDLLIHQRSIDLLKDEPYSECQYFWHCRKDMEKLTKLNEQDLERFMRRLNLQLILGAPMNYLAEVGRACSLFWFPSGVGEKVTGGSRKAQAVWTLVHFTFMGLFMLQLVAIAGTAMTRHLTVLKGSNAFLYSLAALTIFYTMAISCVVDIGYERFRLPTDPLIFLMLWIGLRAWYHTWQEGGGTERRCTTAHAGGASA